MLTNTLNTNEIKDRAGVEQEFTRLSIGDRKTEYAIIGENPALPHRLTISHQETGTGVKKKRRSVVRFDKTTVGGVDTFSNAKYSAYAVIDYPIGNSANDLTMKDCIANLMSFMASLGATTTILYDNTGNGAAALVSGGI